MAPERRGTRPTTLAIQRICYLRNSVGQVPPETHSIGGGPATSNLKKLQLPAAGCKPEIRRVVEKQLQSGGLIRSEAVFHIIP